MSQRTRLALNVAGFTLGGAGLVFVGFRLRAHFSAAETEGLSRGTWLAVVILSVLCAANMVLLAVAWRLLLAQAGARTSLLWSIRTYGITQLAKYVPGNVFQFAGRQSVGVAAGIGGGPLAKSTAFELISLVTTGALFGLLLIPEVLSWFSQPVAVAAFLSACGIAWTLVLRQLGARAARIFAAHLIFFAVIGLAFCVLLASVSDENINESYAVGAFVVAWLIGLLTPGSPAGLGIRESVLLGLLHTLDESPVIQAVVLGRLVTVLGDLSYFLAALALPSRPPLTGRVDG